MPDGKWKGSTFAETFHKDEKYVHFMMNHTKLISPWALSFQSYARARVTAKNEYMEMKKKMESDMEKKIREMLRTVPWNMASSSSVDWEVISQAAQSSSASPKMSMGQLKRAMEDEEKNTMLPELSQEVREEKITKMAVMQRELDRLKEELSNQ